MKVYTPDSLAEALELLSSGKGKPLAGGTDLIIALGKNKVDSDYLVDISSLQELRQITITDDEITMGAGVTFRDILDNTYLKQQLTALWEAALQMGACQIQNRATIGGNICNASPAADSVPVFMALDAECLIASKQGKRRMKLLEFMKAVDVSKEKKIHLESDELLESVTFKKLKNGESLGFSKLGKRNALAISTISCAVKLEAENGKVAAARVFTGCLGLRAMEEHECEKYLTGKSLDEISWETAAEVLSAEVQARLGSRASIIYKKQAVKGVLKDAAAAALKTIGREVI